LKKSFLVLILILVVATFLRVYQLDKVPPSLFGDEVDVGYNAYSLLKTGQDLYGQTLPVLIRSLSEYRAPLFIYSDVPFIAVFGLNEWGVRLAAAFWGVISIAGLYFLTRKLFNEKVALISAFSLAISPWHIQYSRAGFEVTMLLAFETLGTFFFIKGLEKKYFLILSAILFALTPYIYSTAVIFTPILVLLLLFINRKAIFKDLAVVVVALALVAALIVLAPYSYQTISGKAGERFSIISIFSNKELQDKVLLAQKNEQLPLGLQKVFYNKPLIWTQAFTLNYLRAFSPEFLFLQGDPNFRQSIHEMGEMYFYEIILLGFGIFALLKTESKKKWLVLGWLFIAPIPASLTYDGGFHATRNFLMLVPLMMLIGQGGESVINNLKVKRVKLLGLFVLALILLNSTFYLNRYFNRYPIESWRAWNFGFKDTMQFVDLNKQNYERILINNTYEPSLIRFLFWTKYDPDKFHKQFTLDQPSKNITNGYDGFTLDNKYFFGNINGPFEQIVDKDTLLIGSTRDEITNPETLQDKNVSLLKTVTSPTGEVLFYIVSGNK
jgi:4-amino-4-deoxy-L-arabinose transferase-like glycosyltransferase